MGRKQEKGAERYSRTRSAVQSRIQNVQSHLHTNLRSNLHTNFSSDAASPLPKGFRTIILYSIVIGICYLFSALIGVYAPSFGIGQQMSRSVSLLIIALIAAMIYGMKKRKAWAYPVAVFWFVLSILLSLFSMFMIDEGIVQGIASLFWVMAAAIIAVDLLILWYLTNRKQFLLQSHTQQRFPHERAFVRILGGCWIIILLISSIIGVNFYLGTTAVVDKQVEELSGTSIIHALVFCNTKQGQERDICYIILATMYPEQQLEAICGRVESAFFRFTCQQSR